MITSTTPDCVATSRSSSRPPPETSDTEAAGRPADSTASRATEDSTAFECAAIEDPRRTIAFPDFRHSAEQSMVTFGLASYTTATTPSGTRTLRRSSPLGSRCPSIVSPTGSGSAAMERTSEAMPAIRSSVRRSRSSRAAPMSFSSPARMSRALASRISGVRASSASAMASRAAFRTAAGAMASVRDASLAAAQVSGTLSVRVAMLRWTGYPPAPSGLAVFGTAFLVEHEVIPVHGLLARTREHLAHLRGLQPLDLPELFGRVVHDALPDRPPIAARGGHLHRVARLELAEHVDHAHRQQARAALAQRRLGARVHRHAPVRGLRVLEPQLEARDPLLLREEPRALLLPARGALHSAGAGAVGDDGGDSSRRGHLGGHDLGAHATRAERRRGHADLDPLERLEVAHLADLLGGRLGPGVGCVEAVRVGQEQEQVRAEQDRHLRRQEVVVAERDLVGGRRVVLVDHGDHAPVEESPQRLPRVEVVAARAHVEEREEHL